MFLRAGAKRGKVVVEGVEKIIHQNMNKKPLLQFRRAGSMLAKQASLPRLPVPPLQQSMDKYLRAIRPLVNDEDYTRTEKLVSEFRKHGGVGELLQAKLVERSKVEDNWLAKWWDNCAYFDYRMPVVVHSSPGIGFMKLDFKDDLDMYRYGAKLIRAVLNFKVLLDSESVPVDLVGGQPTCMIQYTKLLGSCRIPHYKRDETIVAPKDKIKHIIVTCNNNFYALDVYDNGQPLSEGDLMKQLEEISKMSQSEGDPVGIMTSGERTWWAKARKKLIKDPTNKSNLEAIQNSIFLLCLDRVPPPAGETHPMEDADGTRTARNMIHGCGTKYNSCNRWFDKIMQFCVDKEGHTGVCYEHSVAEAPPVMSLCNFVLKHTSDLGNTMPSTNPNLPTPKKLEWKLSAENIEDINDASEQMNSLVGDLDLRYFKFNQYGKGFAKSQKCSPDAFVQVAFQLAYYRLHGHMAPTYESGSTRKFIYGRTDTIRSASLDSQAFAQGMLSNNRTFDDKINLFRQAIASHTQYTKETINGEAVDRHLLGLKLTAVESGINIPELFMDKAFSYFFHFKMSTSQVPSKFDTVLSFGPVVPDGYGLCYNPREDMFNIAISAFNSNPETNTFKLGSALQKTFEEIQMMLTKAKL